MFALLDTAAAWSVIDDETASALPGCLEDLGDTIPYKTRFGSFRGRSHRLSIELIADPGGGADLSCDATVLVVQEWPGPIVLGFHGFLEWIRFALDPDDRTPTWYFGSRAE